MSSCLQFEENECKSNTQCSWNVTQCLYQDDIECQGNNIAACMGKQKCRWFALIDICISRQRCVNLEDTQEQSSICMCKVQDRQFNPATGKCECPQGQYENQDATQCISNQQCNAHTQPSYIDETKKKCLCKDNAEYINKKCVCKDGYYLEGVDCYLNEQCTNNFGIVSEKKCMCIEGAKKVNNLCQCDTDAHFESNGTACVCEANYFKNNQICEHCDPQHNLSVGQQGCECAQGYVRNLTNHCVDQQTCESQLGKVENGQCNCIDGAIFENGLCQCDTSNHFVLNDNKCGCDNGYYQHNAECNSVEQCVANFGIIEDNACNCIFGAIKQENGVCTCNKAKNFVPKDNKCVCSDNFALKGETCISIQDCTSYEGYFVNKTSQTCECNIQNGFTLESGACIKEDSNNRKGDGPNASMLIGIIIGVLILVAIIVTVIILFKRRHKKINNALQRISTPRIQKFKEINGIRETTII